MRRVEIKSLTSWRGLAAIAVVLQHFSATAALTTSSWIPSLVPHGYMAVDFFFVLSGFVMGYNYLADFDARGWRAYPSFLRRRVARIYPLGIAVTLLILLGAGVAAIWGRADLFIPADVGASGLARTTAINLAFLQGFFPQANLNGPSSTVSLEIAAYVAFPLYVALFGGRRGLILLSSAVCVAVLITQSATAPEGLGTRSVFYDLCRFMAEFGLGVAVFRAYRTPGWLRVFGSDAVTTAVTLVFCAGFLLRYDPAIALCCPLVVLSYALNQGWPSRLLSTRVPHYLGLISFSIYLVHNMMCAPLLEALRVLHPGPLTAVQALAAAAAGSLCVLPVAALTYASVEKPGRDALNSVFGWAGRVWRPVPKTG